MWKQKLGDQATCQNLIHAFENAGYQEYASTVRKLVADLSCKQKSCFSGQSFSSHSPLLLLPQRPVFPNITDTVLLHKQGNFNISIESPCNILIIVRLCLYKKITH